MIAIHHRENSFSEEWIKYCDSHGIQYKLVNCFESDIIDHLKDCKGLMWHWVQWDAKAILFARQLTLSLEKMGVKVFPDIETCWHFDDKVGQKYLLEAIEAPLVDSFVFYDREKAQYWAEKTTYPKVFKLRGGAGALNVQLVKGKTQANRLIRKAFNSGFSHTNNFEKVKDRWGKLSREKNWSSVYALIRGIGLLAWPRLDLNHKLRKKEKGYIYFQEFIPGNDSDIRVIVIGDKAFAIKRMVRENDFKASGSGLIEYKRSEIPIECVKISFEINQKLNAQCVAFDFIKHGSNYEIVEMSFSFSRDAYRACPGYWDSRLNWHEEKEELIPEHFMVEKFIQSLNVK